MKKAQERSTLYNTNLKLFYGTLFSLGIVNFMLPEEIRQASSRNIVLEGRL
jgi:hypothetical protein